jgi:uncharacterized membrane protein YkvA (DUF1232 family)
MSIRKVDDLMKYSKRANRSPEEIAKVVGISNMTIRRLLKSKPSTAIPEKYWPLFERLGPQSPHSSAASMNLFSKMVPSFESEELMKQIEKDGINCKDPDGTLKKALKQSKKKSIGFGIGSLVSELCQVLKSKNSLRKQAIALGALLYFLNPVDLIPDSIPVVGYLDDFAVLTLATHLIQNSGEEQKKGLKTPKTS